MNTKLHLKTKLVLLAFACLFYKASWAQQDSLATVVQSPIITINSTYDFKVVLDHLIPSYKMVVEKFVSDYGFASAEPYFYDFEKRPEGYFVTITDRENYPNIIARELFWSVAENTWKPLSVKKQLPSEGLTGQLIHDQYYFDRVPYYGYRGWYNDVIKALEGQPNLNSDLLFSLANAWDTRATSLLSDQYGVTDSVETFMLPETRNALTAEQLEIYLHYMAKSLAYYQALVNLEPDYSTIVGPATVKLANQYMVVFLQLLQFQNEKTALKILDRAPLPYNDFLLESSRNLLRSCPKNAVLFTYGDNDTYPLLYVQAKQGFRRDVVVANLSLLNTGRYVNLLRDRVFDAAPLQYQLAPEYYYNAENQALYLGQGPELSMADFQTDLTSEDGVWESGYRKCNTSNVYFYTNRSGKILPNSIKTPKKGYKVEIQLDHNYYILRDQIAILDLLYSNFPARPFCFAATCTERYYKPFRKHLRLQGWVYLFDPEPIESQNPDLYGVLEVGKSFDLFAHKFEFSSKGPISSDSDPYLSLIQNFTLFTAKELSQQGQQQKALLLLDQYCTVFPNSRVPFGRYHLFLAEAYDQTGNLDKALEIYQQVLNNQAYGLFDWGSWKEQYLSKIRIFAEKIKNQALLERLDKL